MIHADESSVKQHPDYRAAKSGDAVLAARLVDQSINTAQIDALRSIAEGHESPVLVSAHALEADGINAIPDMFARKLSQALGWEHSDGIIQANVVSHT